MDSFELNKIIGAVLGTLLFVMGVGFIAEAIYSPIEGRGPGYSLPEPEGEPGAEPAEAEAPAVPLGVLLASANVEQGQKGIAKCQSCHNFGEGEANKQGPGLYGVVGRPIAGHEGFSYSDSLAAHGAAGETWTYENLDAFLTAPSAFAKDTKMKFGGIKKPEDRANILAYLATLSASPLPFPPPEAAPAAAEVPAGATPATEAPAVETGGDAVATPTTTQTETPVEGTPTTSAPASETPAATESPATETPAQ
jgi:cytochrome c